MKITKFTTFYKIELDKNNLREELYSAQDLLRALSTINYQTEEVEPFCYQFNGHEIRIPAGCGDEWLRRKLNVEGKIHEGPMMPFDSKKYFNINKRPFPEQMQIIKTVLKHFANGGSRAIIDMQTGRGKTFTSVAVASELGCNILILVKTNVLMDQWAGINGAFMKHTKLKYCHILPMNGSRWFDNTFESQNLGYKVFVTTHASLRAVIKDRGMGFVKEWVYKNKIGCKIYDEFDTEVDSMVNLDLHTATRYTMYLSATTFKNGQYDDMAFQNMIRDTFKYGSELYASEKPNRKAIIYGYNSKPTRQEYGSCYNFKGQFVPDKYMALAITKPNYFDILERVVKENAIPIYEMDKGFKIVIMTGKISSCEIIEKFIMEKFNIPKDHISQFHSEMDKKSKEIALTRPFIISITDSIGRGLDITKIKMTIDMEAYAGGSIFSQATGRVGRVGGEEGIYIKVIDKSFESTMKYYYKLSNFFDKEFKEVKKIDIS